MITLIKPNNKVMVLLEYYKEYHDNVDSKVSIITYSSVVKLFFKKCKEYIFTGETLHLPIGKFKVNQIVRDISEKKVCFPGTKKARIEAAKQGKSEEEIKSIIIYRTNTSYAALQWKQSTLFNKNNLDFVFSTIRNLHRDLPKYFNYSDYN